MRFVNGILCLVFLLFVFVQYNDPDFFFWMPVYAVPAIWTGLVAFKPALLGSKASGHLLLVCLVAALLGTAHFWPVEAGFWQQEVWWESETAREGMGMMIVALGLLAALVGRRSFRLG